MIKAVIFDLYETLVTEWVSKKYLSSQCAKDLGVDTALFRQIWESCHAKMDTGALSYHQVLSQILEKAGKTPDDALITACEQKRIETKNQCFSIVDEDVLSMLRALKSYGLKLALCSNCSADEISGLAASPLYPLFDAVILSYQAGCAKPSPAIYHLCAERLCVQPEECLFVGDGGSRELFGAQDAGLHPLRALWFPGKYHPTITSQPFPAAHTPQDVLHYIIENK